MRISMGDATMRPSHNNIDFKIDESSAGLARAKPRKKRRYGNRRAPPAWQEQIPMLLGDVVRLSMGNALMRLVTHTTSIWKSTRAPPSWQERFSMILGGSQWAMPLLKFPMGKTSTKKADFKIGGSSVSMAMVIFADF